MRPDQNENQQVGLLWEAPLVAKVMGRRVLPLRAIPHLSCWYISAYELAQHMAREDGADKIRELLNLVAYRLTEGRPIRIRTAEWEAVCKRLLEHFDDVRKTVSGWERRHELWSEEATDLLPAASFFWLDDFVAEFNNEDEWGPTFENPQNAEESLVSKRITLSQEQAIFEGFDSIPRRRTPKATYIDETESVADIWKAQAVELGRNYIDAWRAAGFEPTKQDTALYVEGELSTLGQYGDRREVLDASYIERHALKGITGHRPGFKSKKPKIPEGDRGKLPPFK